MADLTTVDWIPVSSVITAIATVMLAIYAYRSFEGIKEQMKLLNKQAVAMTKQADTLENQSTLMRESMEYDRLIRKYERLNKEFAELLGPLISKKDDYLVFESAGDYGSDNPYKEKHKIFWDTIKEKMYLADKALDFELQNYFLAMKKYKESGFIDGYGKRPDEAKNEFMAEKDKLIQQIELSWKKLQEELRNTELELKIR